MNIIRDIRPISALKRDSASLLKQLEQTKAPVVLTRNGEPKFVIQDAEAYQELLDTQRRMEDRLAIQEGLDDFEAGRWEPAEVVLARLEEQYGA